MRIITCLAVSALALAAPVALDDLTSGSVAAAHAEKGGSKDRGDRGKSESRSSSGKEKSSAKKSAKTAAPEKTKNVHAELKGLNSLNRNINGLMNSSDPKMDGFREYVVARATYEAALAELEAASAVYDPLASAYSDLLGELGLVLPDTQEDYDTLAADLSDIALTPAPSEDDYKDGFGVLDDAAYTAALEAWEDDIENANAALADYDAVYDAWQDVDAAETKVMETEDVASEEAMIAAMVDGLNATGAGPVTEADMTDEMIDWVAMKLGIGEAEGLVDDYAAQQAE